MLDIILLFHLLCSCIIEVMGKNTVPVLTLNPKKVLSNKTTRELKVNIFYNCYNNLNRLGAALTFVDI